MNRLILRRFLSIGLLCAGLSGCKMNQDSVVSKVPPEDPTAWTGSEISKEGSATSTGLTKSSGFSGGWSSEARDIEKSLGVGR
ncbi:hypothetical protein P12x_004572 [Tundrisphaera lichenicola]|uniref:hypothetical protein n=1 Tax=Tundrisphaera lichenicola TaxID=2029860 RepID=UPI003EB9F493